MPPCLNRELKVIMPLLENPCEMLQGATEVGRHRRPYCLVIEFSLSLYLQLARIGFPSTYFSDLAIARRGCYVVAPNIKLATTPFQRNHLLHVSCVLHIGSIIRNIDLLR